MTRYTKGAVLVISGLCWLTTSVVFLLLLYGYLSGGAGLQVFGFLFPVPATSVLLGMVHCLGFAGAACLCFVIGVGMLAHGVADWQDG